MRYLHQLLISLLVLATKQMSSMCAQVSSQNFCSSICCNAITIPTALLSLHNGDHLVKLCNHEIVVSLQHDGSSAILPTFIIPTELSADEKLGRIPIVELLIAALLSASKQRGIPLEIDHSMGPPIARFEMNENEEMVDWVTTAGISLASLPRSIIRKQNLLHRGIGALVLDSAGRIYVHQRSSTKKVFPSMFDMFVGGVCSSGETVHETLLRELNEEIGLDFTASSLRNVPENSSKDEGVEDEMEIMRKKNPYYDKIGVGRMFLDEEAFQAFMRNSNMTQKEKKNILISSSVQAVSDSAASCGNSISYLGSTTIETSYNHCIVDCYAAICTKQFAESITFQDGEIEWGEWSTLDALNSMLQDREKEFVPDGMQVWNALPGMIR